MYNVTCRWYMLPDSYLGRNDTSLAIDELEFRLTLSCDRLTKLTLEKPWSVLLIDVFASINETISLVLVIR